jgi:hypothetical protein
MSRSAAPNDYGVNVFINCPFDDEYKPLFEATIFTVQMAGFKPRCAREISNAAQTRLEKLLELVGRCRLAIHDISRTELGANGLPRFNMPLELGIDIGCRKFGTPAHRRKSMLVLDTTPHRYQKFISDIAGQDITAHNGSQKQLVTRVRDWLAPHGDNIPGGTYIYDRFRRFRNDSPTLCQIEKLKPAELTFGDFTKIIRIWLEETER